MMYFEFKRRSGKKHPSGGDGSESTPSSNLLNVDNGHGFSDNATHRSLLRTNNSSATLNSVFNQNNNNNNSHHHHQNTHYYNQNMPNTPMIRKFKDKKKLPFAGHVSSPTGASDTLAIFGGYGQAGSVGVFGRNLTGDTGGNLASSNTAISDILPAGGSRTNLNSRGRNRHLKGLLNIGELNLIKPTDKLKARSNNMSLKSAASRQSVKSSTSGDLGHQNNNKKITATTSRKNIELVKECESIAKPVKFLFDLKADPDLTRSPSQDLSNVQLYRPDSNNSKPKQKRTNYKSMSQTKPGWMSVIHKLIDKKKANSAVTDNNSGSGGEGASVEREKLNKTTPAAEDGAPTAEAEANNTDNTDDRANTTDEQQSTNTSRFFKSTQRQTSEKKEKKSNKSFKAKLSTKDELFEDLTQPDSKLPMVKFDSDGDFFKEPLEIKINKNDNNNNQDDNMSHIIRIGNKIEIDTKKVKRYLKRGFKFAFSQIGLAGLVVGYVILGALMFMKIESEYEKENQNKIEKNREEFFENVKTTAELMFNEYLKSNFHTKYNNYRNEEIGLKNDEEYQRSIGSFNQQFAAARNGSKAWQHVANYQNKINSIELNINRNNEFVKYDRKSVNQKLKPAWYIELDKENFYKEIKQHLRNLLIENDKIEDKDKPTMLVREDVWSYPNALLYSATVITTIGYGNITPKSNAGKILTIFYAMIGIPLMFMCLTNTGDLLAELFISSYSRIIRFLYRRIFKHKLKIPYSSSKFQENKEEMLNEFELEYDNPNDRHVPIVATLGVLTAYILAGAAIFAFTEDWSVLDGAYFCFITFTTIGFGDFVPGKNTLATEKSGMAALCTLYLLVGMIIMAMCFKLMQDEVVTKARWFGRRLGIIDK